MNWTKASAVAEILSSIAILVTLLYLVIEIGQNTEALEAASRQGVLDNSLETLYTAVGDPEIWLSYVKPELTDTERVRMSAYLFGLTQRGQVNWAQYQAGALPETGWLIFQQGLIGTLKYARTRQWWDYYVSRSTFQPAFAEHVNSILAETPIATQLNDIEAFD
jgi:hypothetical protein